MVRIDTSGWKSFQIGDLFDVRKGTRLTKANMKPGEIRFIGSSAMNNGLTAMISNSENIHPANTLTVCYNGSVGETFYQDEPFWASDDVNVLYPKFEMNMYIGMFIAPIIKAVSTRFNFVDKWKQEVMTVSEIKLPAASDGQPDYAYMDQYMREVIKESEASLGNLRQANKSKEAVDIHTWKRFHLYDDGLFDIDMGTKLDRVKMTQIKPEINFVGRANTNNGITGRVDRIADVQPYDAGNLTLSLGGEYLGSCFIQPDAFYTSQNVVVLMPKWDMPFSVKQFVATMIFRESRTYYKAFIDELNRHVKTDFSFFLPVKPDGNPDWDYMGSYMSEMLNNASASLDVLARVAS